MGWDNKRLDRIEQSLERAEGNIDHLAEISEATNRRIERFVEATAEQIQEPRERTEQLQRAIDYLLSKDT